MWGRRDFEAGQRFAERRQRENEAPRLSEVVPALETLRLEVQEGTTESASASSEGSHIRHIVVAHAPALFVITCHHAYCKDGGHDLTHLIMRALRSGQTHFEGEHACDGQVGSSNCQRVLRFVGTATYAVR